MADIESGGGSVVGGGVSAGGGFTGRDEDHRNNVSVHIEDRPATERERVDWRDRQIVELRYALLGDGRYGVNGLVDSVRNQRIWLVFLTILVALVALMLVWQQVQIHQIQFQMQQLLLRLS